MSSLTYLLVPRPHEHDFPRIHVPGHRDLSVLDSDYNLVCYTTTWYILASVCAILILLWPIGIPTLLFVKMYAARELI